MSQRRSDSVPRTLTGSQGSRPRPTKGVVSGHVLKIVRERIPLTQNQLAEELGIDPTTIQGWESGRRPVAAMSSAQFLTLRRHLLRRGAASDLLPLLELAVEADTVLAHALSETPTDNFSSHPLHGWVFTRASTHMLAWALTGRAPAALPPPPAGTPRRRGPTPNSPLLATPERATLFANLRRTAEIADHAGERGALLRRQALYLCSYDTRDDTPAWLADMRSRRPMLVRHTTWTPAWADARSVATSLTRYGDLETLHAFIREGMSDDAGELANLNYWAYWLGLDPLPRANDAFMTDQAGTSWDPLALLRSLADRLDPTLAAVDLNIHSVFALVGAKPGILSADRNLHADLTRRVTQLLDAATISSQSRRELEQVHYGLKLSSQ